MRRGASGPLRLASRVREAETDRLATLTREIVEETGAYAASLLGLIERRAPNISASASAGFILEKWRADGTERERLIAHAQKDDRVIAAERQLSIAIQKLLRPLTGQAFNLNSANKIRKALARFLIDKNPKMARSIIDGAVRDSVIFTDEKISVQTDKLVGLLAPKVS